MKTSAATAGVTARARCTRQSVHRFNPIEDHRWPELVERHPRASVFHSVAWLRALQSTYGYKPVGFTWSSPAEQLQDAVLFCEVDSWITGRRLVSLPFSDHCDSLVQDTQNSAPLLSAVQTTASERPWRYLEVRSLDCDEMVGPDWHTSANYCFHRLDLRPALSTLFRNFHQSSTQRKIRRAEREGLTYLEASDGTLLDQFYRLLIITRKRHHIPPQPRDWFASLLHNFGDALKIRLAFKGDRAVAGMLTIRHKDTLFYKYGGSDARYHKLGAMHLLYWNAIQDAKNQGLAALDLGRSDAGQAGLITFKSRWGAELRPLNYHRFSTSGNSVHAFDPAGGIKMLAIKRLCSLAPAFLLPSIGNLLYKHIG